MAKILIGNVRTPIDYLKEFFAPAGYGLGVNTGTLKSITDVHTIDKTGWYRFSTGTANSFGGSGVICAVVNEDKYITLTSYAHGLFSFDYMSIAIKVKCDGKWGEWDWVNPPMVAGVEYRTTERYMGKPVYHKLISFKLTTSTSTNFDVPHGVNNFGVLVRQFATLQNKIPLPYTHNGNSTSVSEVNESNIVVSNSGHAWDSSYPWSFDLYYTKTTD